MSQFRTAGPEDFKDFPEDLLQEERPKKDSPPLTTDAYRGPTNHYGEQGIQTARKMVADAADGVKRPTLFDAARLLGGLVEGQLLDYGQAYSSLEAAINLRKCDDYQGAYKVIRDGIEAGRKAPITKEQKDAEREEWKKQNGKSAGGSGDVPLSEFKKKSDSEGSTPNAYSEEKEPDPAEPPPNIDANAYLDAILKEAEIDVDVEMSAPPVCLSFDERGYQTTIATLGNFSMLIGKAKSRKTFFVLLMLAAWIRNGLVLNKFNGNLPLKQSSVLHFDTEQGRYHAQRVAQRALKLAGTQTADNFRAYGLRKYPPTTRLELIERAIYTMPNLGIVVIDGIRDLAALGINDEKEATELATKLLKWTEEKSIHIMVVLHQNKNDTNARGHLGTELVNKAETVLSVMKDEKNKDMSVVKADYCRDKDFDPFGFIIDENGLPQLTEHWELKAEGYDTQKGVTALEIPNDTHSAVLAKAFQYSSKVQYSTLVSQVKLAFDHFGKKMGDNKVKDFIQYYQNENLIQLEGKPRSKGSGYILTQVV